MGETVDLILRGGTIVDGSGGDPYEGDVAISDGKIVAVGAVGGRGREEIDARSNLVTPGFVDIHTHYDGHATWATRLQPSAAHGVTTVVMGNCGVGFAPCRPADHASLVRLMEGVEDIPGVVLNEGLPWSWETFPEYLEYLAGRQYDIDIAAQLPHAPLRVYVMGQRAIDREAATDDDIAQMAKLAEEAMRAGAIGFSSSRSINHRASDGNPIPSVTAAEHELTGIACGLKSAGSGVVQLISDFSDEAGEFGLVRKIVEASGRPLSMSLLQLHNAPERWKTLLKWIDEANDAGIAIKAQVCARPVCVLMGLELSYNPFTFCPSYQPIRWLPLAERVALLRQPDMRARLISEFPAPTVEGIGPALANLSRMFPLGDPPNYEPTADQSIAAEAARRGVPAVEYAYDHLLEREGKTVLYAPAANYAYGNIDAALEMVTHNNTVLGLGDGGAHCGLICDASMTTHMLSHWARGRHNGALPLPSVVRSLTSTTACTVGLADRGLIAEGYRADVNIIDFDRLALHMPEMVYDLPSGGGRLHQRADGYVATIVNGQVTYRDGVATGNLPGRLVRGPQVRPSR